MSCHQQKTTTNAKIIPKTIIEFALTDCSDVDGDDEICKDLKDDVDETLCPDNSDDNIDSKTTMGNEDYDGAGDDNNGGEDQINKLNDAAEANNARCVEDIYDVQDEGYVCRMQRRQLLQQTGETKSITKRT